MKLDESLLRARGLLLNLGEVERQGDVEARVRIGEEVLALGNREAEVESRTAAAHVARAWAREQRGDRKGALADAERAVSLSPDAPQGHYLLGVLRSRSLSWSQAAVSLSRAVALNPEAVAFVRERARVHLLQGQLDRALSDASRAIELDASRADAWVTRAMVHIARRDLASADRDLTEALGREPGSIDARRARASLRAERGDHAGALADLDDLATRAPGDGAHWFERCRVLRAVGDPVTALEALRRAAACGHVLAAEELRALGLG